MLAVATATAADLISDELLAERQAGLGAFEALIGSWDLRYRYRRASGEQLEGGGYANFGWGLRGTALVDIWAFDLGYAGTTIRFYDPTIDRIRSTWICPAQNAVIPFLGRSFDGKIVLNATVGEPPGRRVRWSFVSIAGNRFSWTGEICDDGSTWLHVSDIEGTRR